LGFILIGAQIVLLREFMLVFMGNELIVGLLLTLWLLLSGAGVWSGKFFTVRRPSTNLLVFLFILLTVFPLISAFSLGYFRAFFFEAGRMISLIETIIFASVLLFPVCFTGGLLFALLNFPERHQNARPVKWYAFEALGSLVGGLQVGVVFIGLLSANNFQSLEYLALISFIFLGILYFQKKELLRTLLFLFLTILMLLMVQFYDLGFHARERLYPNQVLIQTKDTPYGSIDLTRSGKQENIYENGSLIYASDNVIGREEDVHYAMLQKPAARQLLLMGGAVSGTIAEILKYKSVQQLDYLELNPVLFERLKRSLPGSDQLRISLIAEDPVHFVRKTTNKYDVILIHEPPPLSVQTNRFYTVEFFRELKRKLHQGGLIATRLPASENYLSDEELEMESVVYRSLNVVFKQVLLVPGQKHSFIASDAPLSLDYTALLQAANISNHFVNENYINDHLLKMRSEAITQSFHGDAPLNHDFKPTVYLLFIKQWLHFYGNQFQPILLFAAVLMLLFLLFSKPAAMAMFSSGFSGASAEIVLLIAFQSMLGYLYLFLGLMISVFMAGLVVGAWMSRFYKKVQFMRKTVFIQLISGLLLLCLPVLLFGLKTLLSPLLIEFTFALLMFLLAIPVGLQYGALFLSGKSNQQKQVPVVYAADLLGAGLGSFITALWLVPVYGIYYSLLILGSLHFVTVAILFLKRRKNSS